MAGHQTRALGQGNALSLKYIFSPFGRFQGHANLDDREDRTVVMSAQGHNCPYFRDKVMEAAVSHTKELAWSVALGDQGSVLQKPQSRDVMQK